MLNKYLIRMNEPEDWLRHWDEGTQVVNDFILPIGPYEKDEMSDTIYHKDASVPYHQHTKGFETFLVGAGSVECVMRGKRFVIHEGDIVHIMPYTPHGFRHLEEGTIWRELFQEINMAQGIMNKNTVNQNWPGLLDDPEFRKIYRTGREELARETPVPIDVDKHDMYEVRTPEFAYSTYQLDGCELKLKIGRWECNGVKEVWHATMEKGLTVEFATPHCNWELYYVTKGAVQFDIMGEVFTATKDCLVHIPPFHAHTIKVLEDSEMYDYGGETYTMALLEDYESIKTYQPDKLNDAAFMTEFKKKYRCFVTGFHKE